MIMAILMTLDCHILIALDSVLHMLWMGIIKPLKFLLRGSPEFSS